MDTSLSLGARGKQILLDADFISKLPDQVLIKILTNLDTEQAIKTSLLSKRWSCVWKQVPYIAFDMQRTFLNQNEPLDDYCHRVDELITKVINNHNGNVVSCIIHHFINQLQDGSLEKWILLLIHEKNTKFLQLENLEGPPCNKSIRLHLPPNAFSHPTLESLSLYQYGFDKAHAFHNGHNLKVLKLVRIFVPLDVLNTIITMCATLKVLMLEFMWYQQLAGCLEIHNDNLKLLHLRCNHIGSIKVNAPLLDIFSVYFMFDRIFKVSMINAPRLPLNPKVWDVKERIHTIVYNISYYAQEEENLGHEFVVSRFNNYLGRFKSLVVTVDLMNPREVEMFKEVLVAWCGTMMHLEILFKNNDDEEAESSIGRAQMMKWEEAKMFPNADFRVKVVTMLNFNGSNKEQFAFASLFIMQGTVKRKMRIKTSSTLAREKLEMETAVAKLMELPKGNERLCIECY